MSVACIGECMVELSSLGDDRFSLAFGGDTLNTAVYLARSGIEVDYVTALGDDPLSDRMIAFWRSERIGVDRVLRLPGRMPGLYMIQRDENGERSFLYWRDRAPARDLFDVADDDYVAALADYDWIYLSGVTLSLYGEAGRARLLHMLKGARNKGAHIVFDSNYRPRGWSGPQAAREALDAVLPCVDIVLPTFEDEHAVYGDADSQAIAVRLLDMGAEEVVVKQGAQGAFTATRKSQVFVPIEAPVAALDTTGAGDAFNAAYLAARMRGETVVDAARAGHRLAGVVVQHRGAIIPADAMPGAS